VVEKYFLCKSTLRTTQVYILDFIKGANKNNTDTQTTWTPNEEDQCSVCIVLQGVLTTKPFPIVLVQKHSDIYAFILNLSC
jgi:hypothetical protein